jgi:hypothetical protein
MPKEQVVIEQFRGMFPAADARDLDLQYALHVVDVDPFSKQGELRGRFDDIELSANNIPGYVFKSFADGTQAISFDGSAIHHITGIPGAMSATSIATPTSSGKATLSTDGRSVRAALGSGSTHLSQWVGDIDHAQIDGAFTAPAGTANVADARLIVPGGVNIEGGSVSITAATSSDETAFPAGFQQAYRASFEYDGYQNGPMKDMGGVTIDTATYADGAQQIGFDILFTSPVTNLPRRVTAINIWRNYRATGAANYLDLWRLAERIDINHADWIIVGGGPNYEYPFVDQGSTTEDWESLTGLPDKSDALGVYSDTLEINYQLTEMLNGYHFIADIYHPLIKQTSNFMLRSLRNRPDMYNWAEDFLVLPTKPIALASFLGKLYAFGTGVMYRIDPERFEIEETIAGYGVYDQQSVTVTERGMLFCNEDNIYLHDGVQVRPIGYPVMNNDYDPFVSWSGATHATPPICVYDARKDVFIILFESSAAQYHGFIYSPELNTWHIYEFEPTLGGGVPTGGFVAATGEPMVSFDGIMVQIAGHFTRKAWKWVSKEINNGGEQIIPYWIHVDGDAHYLRFIQDCDPEIEIDLSANLEYDGCAHRVYLNDQIPASILGSGAATSWGRMNKLRIEVVGDSDHSVNSISLQIRRVRKVSAVSADAYNALTPEFMWIFHYRYFGAYSGIFLGEVRATKLTYPDFGTIVDSVDYDFDDNTLMGRNAQVDSINGKVFVSVATYDAGSPVAPHKLFSFNIDGTGKTELLSLGGTEEISDLTLDRTNQRIYYVQGQDTIKWIRYDGTGETTIHTSASRLFGCLALNAAKTKLYAAFDGTGADEGVIRIDVSTGVTHDILFTDAGTLTTQPILGQGAVDRDETIYVFANQNQDVIKVPLDGSGESVLLNGILSPHLGITIDPFTETIWWGRQYFVYSMNFAGGEFTPSYNHNDGDPEQGEVGPLSLGTI